MVFASLAARRFSLMRLPSPVPAEHHVVSSLDRACMRIPAAALFDGLYCIQPQQWPYLE